MLEKNRGGPVKDSTSSGSANLCRFKGKFWQGRFHGVTTKNVPSAAIPPKLNRFFPQHLPAPGGDIWVSLHQTHTTRVISIDAALALPPEEEGCDGAVTDNPRVVLTVQTADCVPIFIYDPRRPAIGLLHAGWRGAQGGILENGIDLMHRRYGAEPSDLQVWLGPAIGPCCYEVGPEVAEAFQARQQAGAVVGGNWLVEGEREGKWQLDLHGYLKAVLVHRGVSVHRIERMSDCTACRSDQFFSFRARPSEKGRMLSFLGLSAGNPVVDRIGRFPSL